MIKYSVFLENVPSVNKLYFHMKTGIRIPTKELKDFAGYWKDKSKTVKIPGRAEIAFNEAKIPRSMPMVPTVIELVGYWATMRRADMPNFHKAIGDAMVNAGLFEDDWPLLFRDMEFFYPDNPKRTIPKGIQGFMVTIYQKESE